MASSNKSNSKPRFKSYSVTPISAESILLLPPPPSLAPIVDTHTHLALTYSNYRSRYPNSRYRDVYEFVKGVYGGRNVEAIVDVWCEAPVRKSMWKEYADSALTKESRAQLWAGIEYWFVMGVHPHNAKLYNDQVEKDILEVMSHPRCVGWGEMGLDYHYNHSPRDVQRDVFIRQLKQAVRLGKPLTIHSREADDDTEKILKELVPKDHQIHIHCFTNAPAFARRLMDHFQNLYIGITGVITYSSNVDTSTTIRQMIYPPSTHKPVLTPQEIETTPKQRYVPGAAPPPARPTPSRVSLPISATIQPPPPTDPDVRLRIILETDAPYMVPSNVYASFPSHPGKLPICHTAMLPWTARFIADVINGVRAGSRSGSGVVGKGVEVVGSPGEWDSDRVMRISRENARKMYGV